MATEQALINGIDVELLKDALDQFRGDPSLGRFQFRCHNQWTGGSTNRSEIKDFYGAGQEDTSRSEPFVLECDEPRVLLGGDGAPNPVEYILHALAGCITSSLIYHAAARGIEIESIDSTVEGDIDVRGFLGLSNDVPRGYQRIRVTLRVKSDAPSEKLVELAKYSPVYNTLVNPLNVELNIQKA